MLVTISVMAALTGIAVKTLSAMLISERNGVQHVADLATVSRLARQFRNDVHVASAIETNPAASGQSLVHITVADGHVIDYQLHAAGLLRTERRPNLSPLTELWRLKEAQFECLVAQGSPQIVTLVLHADRSARNVGKTRSSFRDIHVEAVQGRDRPPSG